MDNNIYSGQSAQGVGQASQIMQSQAAGQMSQPTEMAGMANTPKSPKKNKKTIIALVVMLMTIIGLTAALVILIQSKNTTNDDRDTQTTSSNVDTSGTKATSSDIQLGSYEKNVEISAGGNYSVTGTFAHAIVITTNQNVKLTLNNVSINNTESAAIMNLAGAKLEIVLADGTTNTLTDGGASDYDGCIYSTGALVFSGNGSLNLTGQQREGEGIATENNTLTINSGNFVINAADDGLNAGGDSGGTITINGGTLNIHAGGDAIDSNSDAVINGGDIYAVAGTAGEGSAIDTENGYFINGGKVVALGTSLMDGGTPDEDSKQGFVAKNLGQTVAAGTAVRVVDANGGSVLEFTADASFRTAIVSAPGMSAGANYSLSY